MASDTVQADAPGAARPRPGRAGGSGGEAGSTSSGRPPRFRYTLPGAWVALVFVCLAFTPSLLPRSGVVQGAICGITGAIGYGLGVLGAWVWRAFADRDARPAGRTSWRVFFVVGAIAVVASYLLGRRWQAQIRDLMGVEPDTLVSQLLLPVVAALLFVGLVAASRGLRRLYRALARLLRRWIGPRAASAVGWVVVVGGTYLLVSGVLLDSLSSLANESFSVANGITQEGVTQPTSSLRSGGPGSLVSWDSLGREGRTFMSGGPTASDISSWSGTTAQEPIRAFAGLESASDTEARADLAVQDLERAGGFDRAYLMVATTTGSGWVSPGGADTFEYMAGGDSAIVAIQYSYLPSWISYLVDQAEARGAGRALFDAVYERWIQLPADQRPKLIIFGESLGTFGGEAAFSGEQDMANRTSGALLTGPPNFNVLYREYVDGRDAGEHRGRAGLPRRPHRALRQHARRRDPAGRSAVAGHPRPLRAAPVGPDRLVVAQPDPEQAGLAVGATRTRRAQRDALDPLRHLLAGHGRPPPGGGGPSRPRPPLHDRVRRRVGAGAAADRIGPLRGETRSSRSSPPSSSGMGDRPGPYVDLEAQRITFLVEADGDATPVSVWYHLRDFGSDPTFSRSEGDRWEATIPMPPVDRLEYLLVLRSADGTESMVVDPANPSTVPGAFGDKSVLELPGYRPPGWLSVTSPAWPSEPVEATTDVPGVTVAGELLTPPGHALDDPLPLLVVHDGPEYGRLARLGDYLDWLSIREPALTCRVLLLQPDDRNLSYAASAAYTDALVLTALPLARQMAATVGETVGLGASLGALALAHAAATHPGTFGGSLLPVRLVLPASLRRPRATLPLLRPRRRGRAADPHRPFCPGGSRGRGDRRHGRGEPREQPRARRTTGAGRGAGDLRRRAGRPQLHRLARPARPLAGRPAASHLGLLNAAVGQTRPRAQQRR